MTEEPATKSDRGEGEKAFVDLSEEEVGRLVREFVEGKVAQGESAEGWGVELFESLRGSSGLSLSRAQVMAAREALKRVGVTGAALREFDAAWAGSDPREALAALEAVPEEERGQYLENILPVLAVDDPKAAIALFHSLEPELRDEIRPHLLEGLVDHDPEFATEYIIEDRELTVEEERSWKPMDQLAREMAKEEGLEATLDWAKGLERGALRANAWSAAYAVWAVEDVHGALESIESMSEGSDRDQAINGMISAHAPVDGLRAVEWAGEISEPRLRGLAQVRAGRHYFAQDPEGARRWFEGSGLPEEAWGQVKGE